MHFLISPFKTCCASPGNYIERSKMKQQEGTSVFGTKTFSPLNGCKDHRVFVTSNGNCHGDMQMFERVKHHSSADIIPNFIFIFLW